MDTSSCSTSSSLWLLSTLTVSASLVIFIVQTISSGLIYSNNKYINGVTVTAFGKPQAILSEDVLAEKVANCKGEDIELSSRGK